MHGSLDPDSHQNLIDPEHHWLKDWPPDGDIAEYIPRRFHNLVNDFPIGAYTLREGPLNLASYMPDYLLRPELGPKMYIAYGKFPLLAVAVTSLVLFFSLQQVFLEQIRNLNPRPLAVWSVSVSFFFHSAVPYSSSF